MARSITTLGLAASLVCACTFDWARYEPMSSGSDGVGAAGAGGSEASAGSTADGGTTSSVTSSGAGGNGGTGGSSSTGGNGGDGGTVMPLCTVSFSDDFADGTAAPEWVVEADTISVDETGGQLELDIPAGPSGNAGYALAQNVALIDGYASMQVPLAPAMGDDGYMALRAYDSNGLYVQIEKGGSNSLRLEEYDGTNYITHASVTYDAVTMAWWRLRNEAGYTHLDTSPDGETWTSQGSVVDTDHVPFDVVSVRIRFHARGLTALHMLVDNFELCF